MSIHFYKYQSGGSDFVILDNRDGKFNEMDRKEAFMICDRHYGVGANGLVLWNEKEDAFDIRYFRFDGREEAFSANAGHCFVALLRDLGTIKEHVAFSAKDGKHEGKILEDGQIDLKLADIERIDFDYQTAIVYAGVPNCVRYAQYLGDIDVFGEGRKLNKQTGYRKEGINLSYIEYGSEAVEVRTYERGIEQEVLSCGTGAVSSVALIVGHESKHYEVPVAMMGGDYKVRLDKVDQQSFRNIWLTGRASKVMEGDFEMNEAWKEQLDMDDLFRKEK